MDQWASLTLERFGHGPPVHRRKKSSGRDEKRCASDASNASGSQLICSAKAVVSEQEAAEYAARCLDLLEHLCVKRAAGAIR